MEPHRGGCGDLPTIINYVRLEIASSSRQRSGLLAMTLRGFLVLKS